MKLLTRLLSLLTAALLVCGGALAEAAPGDVLATVNGDAITRVEFDEYLATLMNYYDDNGYDVTDPDTLNEIREMTMSTLVQLRLMDQQIAEKGLALTDEERADAAQDGRERWAEDVRSAMGRVGVTDADDEAVRAAALVQVLSELEALGYTEQSYIDEAVENALYIKLEDQMVSGVTVTDAQIAAGYHERVAAQQEVIGDDVAFYEYILQMNQMSLMGYTDSYTELFYRPEGYRRVVHILLAVDEALLMDYIDLQAAYEEQQSALEEGGEVTGEAVTAEELENARLAVLASVQGEVDAIHQKLADGETFAAIIPQYTDDPDMNSDAEIAAGQLVHMDSAYLPIGYRDAAFSVEEPGSVADPIVTDVGVYLICYVGDVAGGGIPLTEDMADVIRMELQEAAETKKYNEVMNGWIEAAELVYSDEALAFMGYME